MDELLILSGFVCIIAGVIGCVLPVLPGPLISYAGLVLLQLSSNHPFSLEFLVLYAFLTAAVMVLDNLIPVYGTKKLHGSKYGIWGSGIGMAVGLFFFFPVGIILGPMAGAFIGELISGKDTRQAVRSAFGSFLGFLAGTTIKFLLSLSMAFYFLLKVYAIYNS